MVRLLFLMRFASRGHAMKVLADEFANALRDVTGFE